MKRRTAIALVGVLVGVTISSEGIAAADLLPPQIHTVAGTGSCSGVVISGGPFDDVAAKSVPICGARSVSAVPGGGYLFVDEGNNLVREVSPSGTVTTVAGTTTVNAQNQIVPYTTDVDNVPATSSGLDDPVSVAALPSGGFLITEYCGSRVRLVSPDGTITTIAGIPPPDPPNPGGISCPNAGSNGSSGLGTSVQLNHPMDAQPTASGGVLIADYYNNRIMLLSPDGTISEIAGPGNGVSHPDSVSELQDGSGGYVFSEYENSDVREGSQEAATGTVTTVAGQPGSQGYSGDGGPATSAQLDAPDQVTSTPGGGFLIADTGNSVVRQVSPSGTIFTIAGDGFTSFGGDGGDATAAFLDAPASVSQLSNGNVLIADQNNDRIREITIPPVSTVSFSPASPNGNNGWYTSAVTAKVKATESAKVNCIFDPPAVPTVFGEIPSGCSALSISGDGFHTVYAASMNSFGDQENPIDAVVKIDTTPPVVTCNGNPSFRAGRRHAVVTATVTDQISGPVAPIVSAPANTSSVGTHDATLVGLNNAGALLDISCSYHVLAMSLNPTPKIIAAFAIRSNTTIGRLVVSRIPRGAAVNVVCTGQGCPFARALRVTGRQCKGKPCQDKAGKRYASPRGVDLTPLFAGAALAAGDKLTVSVTERNTVGKVWRYTIRAGRQPRELISCLEPGVATVGKGCTAR